MPNPQEVLDHLNEEEMCFNGRYIFDTGED